MSTRPRRLAPGGHVGCDGNSERWRSMRQMVGALASLLVLAACGSAPGDGQDEAGHVAAATAEISPAGTGGSAAAEAPPPPPTETAPVASAPPIPEGSGGAAPAAVDTADDTAAAIESGSAGAADAPPLPTCAVLHNATCDFAHGQVTVQCDQVVSSLAVTCSTAQPCVNVVPPRATCWAPGAATPVYQYGINSATWCCFSLSLVPPG